LTTLAGITDHEEQDENTQEGKSVDSFSRDVKHTNKMPQWTKKKSLSVIHHVTTSLLSLPGHQQCSILGCPFTQTARMMVSGTDPLTIRNRHVGLN
jgi:hypothetical protein